MDIFISWSGTRSRKIAEAIRGWLPKVLQSAKPWMSDEDIDAGSRWLTEISSKLNSTTIGIICVTPENQSNPWLLFEAGALSKTIEQTCVCPLVFDMTPGQLAGPLTQFQANTLDKDGIARILSTVNRGLGDRMLEPRELEEIVDVWWPKLQEKLDQLPPATESHEERTTSDQLEELLSLAREQMRRENIRLEASQEREEKMNHLLGFLEKSQQSMKLMDQRVKDFQKIMLTSVNSISEAPNTIEDVTNKLSILTGAINEPPFKFDPEPLGQMMELFKGMQEQDKLRLESMLNPKSGQNGECSDTE